MEKKNNNNKTVIAILLLIIIGLALAVAGMFVYQQRTLSVIEKMIEEKDEGADNDDSDTASEKGDDANSAGEADNNEAENDKKDKNFIEESIEKISEAVQETSDDDANSAGESENAGQDNKQTASNGNTDTFDDGVSTHGALHFFESKLKDSRGEDFQLRGMSTHGLLWYPEYTNYNSILYTRKRGANSMRVAMYANDDNGGYVQNKDMSLKLMHIAVENIKAADMYVVIDWHVLNEKDPNVDTWAAKEFFSDISKLYGDDPAIIYEICNEPNGDTNWDMIANYANEIIPCIRANAPNAIIIVGTPSFSYDIRDVLGRELSYENVAYSFHFYAGQFNDDYTNILKECGDYNLPVVVSEWGINTNNDFHSALSQGGQFISYINDRNISWFAWGLSNKDECFSVFKYDCAKYSDFTDNDLTDVGHVIFGALSR